jgi:hypothetical protein
MKIQSVTVPKLEVRHLLKLVEEDIFNEGCIPETAQHMDVDFDRTYENQDELIEDICNFLGIENDKENYLLNSCDEEGRIDFQLMENAEGYPASSRELALWKEGKCRLWAATYSAYVEEVIRKSFKLAEGK